MTHTHARSLTSFQKQVTWKSAEADVHQCIGSKAIGFGPCLPAMADPASNGWPAGKVFDAATQSFTYDDLVFMPGLPNFESSEVGKG